MVTKTSLPVENKEIVHKKGQAPLSFTAIRYGKEPSTQFQIGKLAPSVL